MSNRGGSLLLDIPYKDYCSTFVCVILSNILFYMSIDGILYTVFIYWLLYYTIVIVNYFIVRCVLYSVHCVLYIMYYDCYDCYACFLCTVIINSVYNYVRYNHTLKMPY